MRKLITKHIILVVWLVCGSVLSQTYTDGSSASDTDINSIAAQLRHLNAQTSALPYSGTTNSKNNSIYVQQIGNYNTANANIYAAKSNVGLFQTGNTNEIHLDVKAGIIDEVVIQTGVNNRFIDLSSHGTREHTAAVIQHGRNQNLIWYGNNSISEKMMVTMKGRNQTIIVRNFK